ncbi:MAG: hypothetical protein BroJett020_08720 [Bacteroidota bacterium]|nr:MAG: hypothetical protein BroJett020_08720 [Bacteroidota bacterium]
MYLDFKNEAKEKKPSNKTPKCTIDSATSARKEKILSNGFANRGIKDPYRSCPQK